MNLGGKSSGWPGRGAPVEDPVQIRQAMQELLRLETEIPIKVEGTHTLPYAARIQHLDLAKGLLHMKLIRPLPHEMLAGAAFEMVFTVGDLRYEAPIVFHGREGYLLYRFTLPIRMAPSDRRHHKRYPFRPREKAYVIAQDGGIPGYGLSGPLVNLSMGGLAFRVDRVMRLDDHLRVTPGMGFLERGKAFPMLKIRDLPNLPVLEARGIITHALEHDGEIIVGLQFGDLGEAELYEIQGVLDIRERMLRSPVGVTTESARESGTRSPAETKGPAARVPPAGNQTPDALKILGRRSTRLLLAMPPGPDRDQVRLSLGSAGYLRLETTDTLDQALADLRINRNASQMLLVLEVSSGESASLAGVFSFQRELGDMRELPVALIARNESFPDTGDPLIRPMPWPVTEDLSWLPLLDELAGL